MMQLTAFRVGAVAWTFTGVAHDVLEFALSADPQLTAAMRASSVEVGPVHLNAESLHRGVSLAMGLAMIVVGILLWMISEVLRDNLDRLRRFGRVALLSSILALGLAVVWVPGPPLVTFTVATAAFTAALLAKTPASSSRSGRHA
ncbi:LIC_13387 family protein [Kribbella sp. GL6]|uniref:LIC_13387 family protein n=1 Tax=Kribbella sp. GL6 TaxID=3419765 RepID=UPI003D0621A9